MNETIATSDGLVSLPAIQDLAETYRLSAKAFAYTFRAVAMPQPHSEAEFVSCCLVAKEHGLNPLTKEIYFMRDKHRNIQAIVGVDGWIKKCNQHPQFDGMEFESDVKDGKIVSMTVSIFRKDRTRPIRVTEYMSECVQVLDKAGPWQSHPNRMLRNRTICQGGRIAFGFSGIMEREEFDQWQAMKDVTPAAPVSTALPLPEIPDIPDIPVDEPVVDPIPPDDEADAPLEDVDGFLAQLTEQRQWCESESDVQELREGMEDLIARLPDVAKAKANEILERRPRPMKPWRSRHDRHRPRASRA